MKAVREALDKVSLPTLLVDVPGGVANARVKAKIGVPKHVSSLAMNTSGSGYHLRPACPCKSLRFDMHGTAHGQ